MKSVHITDKKKSRLFFAVIWCTYTLVYMTKSCFTAAMASIVAEGVMTKSQTGLIVALFFVVYTPLQIPAGVLADKYDPEKLIEFGLVGSGAINLVLFFFNHNYIVVLVMWALSAVVQFAIWPSIFKITSSQLEPGGRKTAAYLLSFNSSAGVIVAFLVAALMPRWHFVFIISAAVLFLSAAVLHWAEQKVRPFTVSDAEPEDEPEENKTVHNVSAHKLFLESGFYFILIITFLRTVVWHCVENLSSTILMEKYSVPPSAGNLINIVIVAVGIVGVVLANSLLYPKHIKSAPIGVTAMLSVAALSVVFMIFIGSLNMIVVVILLCLAVSSLSAAAMFNTYCNLRYEKFGKSGTAAGLINVMASLGIVFSSYGVTKSAESFGWQTVFEIMTFMLAAALILSLIMIPLWIRFKKKYHSYPKPAGTANIKQ